MPFWKKVNSFFNKGIFIVSLFIPLLIFLNRFLLPDMSFDSINYHVFSGGRVFSFWKYFNTEFYPAGLHSFPPIFDYFGGVSSRLFGYRLGSICSLLFLYGIIFLLVKLLRFFVDTKISSNLWLVLFFINIFISLEAFFQLGTYYVDIIGSFFVLWTLYLTVLYIKLKQNRYLYLSGLMMGLSVAGKMTNLIYVVPLFVLGCLYFRKKIEIKSFLIYLSFFVLPIIFSFAGNFIKTGNPVFPFYNSVFRSKYFPQVDFENTNYGGRFFVEKLLWPLYSVKDPTRLGEGHDLFNDYKLNIYFLLLIPSLFFAYKQRKKDKLFWGLNTYFFLSVLVWNFSFGYLRYAYVLEMLGGLILFIWVSKILDTSFLKYRKIKFLPIIFLLFVFGFFDKRAINFNLAFDVSWRQTFAYNRLDYVKEYKNIFKNKLDDVVVDEQFKPDLYLNCSSPGLSFYTLSQFNTLPVVNVDSRASGAMTSNYYYQEEVNKRLLSRFDSKDKLKFVTIVGNSGLSNQYRDCMDTLKSRSYFITKQISVDNFLGYAGQKLVYIFGEY